MYCIIKPSENIDEHLNNCISKCLTSKEELLNFIPKILKQAKLYEEKALIKELYTIEPIENNIFDFEAKLLIKLYKTHMVRKGSIGRNLYDKLMSRAKNGKCPFCTHGTVTTLDHYLPKNEKTGFPELSIVPINLVPCCRDCNSKKSETKPNNAEEQYIHPYFDDVNQVRWLFASVNYQINNEPTIEYYVNQTEGIDSQLFKCINFQFKQLELARLYSLEAAEELSNIENTINNLRLKLNKDEIKEHLLCEAKSKEKNRKNTWQTALYYGLAEDERYCAGEYGE